MSWYRFFLRGATPFVRIMARVNVTGRENLPATGPFILAAGSHRTNIESLVIPVCLSDYEVHYFAKSELWKYRPMAWFMNATGQVPVQRFARSDGINPAVEAGAAVLNSGGVLAVYPEGTFSRDGKVHRGRTGMARMAIQANVPVIPLGLVGMTTINPSGLRVRAGRAEIHIGTPIHPEAFCIPDHIGSNRLLEERRARLLTDAVMNSLSMLTGLPYDNTYAKSRRAM